jgi:hypothetical protein
MSISHLGELYTTKKENSESARSFSVNSLCALALTFTIIIKKHH